MDARVPCGDLHAIPVGVSAADLGGNLWRPLRLRPLKEQSIRVLDDQYLPAAGAEVLFSGSPIADLPAWQESENALRNGLEKADASGRCRIPLPAGAFTLAARMPGGVFGEAVEVEVAPDAMGTEILLQTGSRMPSVITLNVRDARGMPVSGAVACLEYIEGLRQAASRADGRGGESRFVADDAGRIVLRLNPTATPMLLGVGAQQFGIVSVAVIPVAGEISYAVTLPDSLSFDVVVVPEATSLSDPVLWDVRCSPLETAGPPRIGLGGASPDTGPARDDEPPSWFLEANDFRPAVVATGHPGRTRVSVPLPGTYSVSVSLRGCGSVRRIVEVPESGPLPDIEILLPGGRLVRLAPAASAPSPGYRRMTEDELGRALVWPCSGGEPSGTGEDGRSKQPDSACRVGEGDPSGTRYLWVPWEFGSIAVAFLDEAGMPATGTDPLLLSIPGSPQPLVSIPSIIRTESERGLVRCVVQVTLGGQPLRSSGVKVFARQPRAGLSSQWGRPRAAMTDADGCASYWLAPGTYFFQVSPLLGPPEGVTRDLEPLEQGVLINLEFPACPR